MMRTLFIAIPVVGLATSMAACASAPKSGDPAGLMIPPPPPHVVPITPEPVVEPVGEIPASPTNPAGRTPPRNTPPPRPQNAERPEAKPDTKPADVPAQPETPPAPVAPPPPAPQLTTPETTGAASTVHASIDRTRSLLSNVDYRRLSKARQKAYEDARALAQQAEDALKAGNVVFAQGAATKAETLAKELASR